MDFLNLDIICFICICYKQTDFRFYINLRLCLNNLMEMQNYRQSLLDEIDASYNEFKEQCQKQVFQIATLMDNKFQLTQKILNETETSIMNIKVEQNEVRYKSEEKQFKTVEIQIWNQIKKKNIELQQEDLKGLNQINQTLKLSLEHIDLRNKQTRNKVNQKQVRRDKLAQFSQRCQIQRKTKHIPVSTKIYSPLTNENKQFEPKVEFNPENRELIFRVDTFEGRMLDFILFYDDNQGRYGLKNPFKVLKSADILAVKNFNVHQSKKKMFKQLQDIVKIYIDNSDK